jgi:hypothetical protein
MARPTKYNEERSGQIIDCLKAGNTRTAAAALAGIDQDTLTNWINRYSDFSEAVKKAEAEAETRSVKIIQEAANHSWQAAAWWLERRRYEDWKKREEKALTDKDGGALKVVVEYADSAARDPIDPAEAAHGAAEDHS